jgi:hypothetical protein
MILQESNSEVEVGNLNRTYSYDIIGSRSIKPKPNILLWVCYPINISCTDVLST